MEPHTHGKQGLDHAVMEFFPDPFPILEDGQTVDHFVQSGILDGHTGLGRQHQDVGFVSLIELGSPRACPSDRCRRTVKVGKAIQYKQARVNVCSAAEGR
jgi:hypothetical protein